MASTFFGLNIARSGMSAYSAWLNTTGHNISNVKTPGYSRQTVNQAATGAISYGTRYGMVGSGTEAVSITSQRDIYYDAKYRISNSTYGKYSTRTYYMQSIESYLYAKDSQTGAMTNSLTNFFKSLSNLTTNVSNTTNRTEAIGFADTLTYYMQEAADNLQQLQKDVNIQIASTADQINSYAEQLVSLNRQINTLEVYGGTANDLRDQRAYLLDQLSELVDIEVIEKEPVGGKGYNQFIVTIGSAVLVDTYEYNTIRYEALETTTKQGDVDNMYDLRWSNGQDFGIHEKGLGGKMQALFDLRDGNNGEVFEGKVTGAANKTDAATGAITGATLTVEGTNDIANSLFKLDIPEGNGVITVGNSQYEYSSFDVEIDAAGKYTYTFHLKTGLGTNAANIVGKDTKVGDAVDFRGVPYYVSQLNEFIRKFSYEFNQAQLKGYDLYGNQGKEMFLGVDKVSGKELNFGTENLVEDVNGVLRLKAPTAADPNATANYTFSSTWPYDASGNLRENDGYALTSYYSITAFNTSIDTKIIKDSRLLACSDQPKDPLGNVEASNANNLINNILTLGNDTTMFKQGQPASFLQVLTSTVGVDSKKDSTAAENAEYIKNAVDNRRLSTAGVDEDEEGQNLIICQNLLNYQYKVLSVMNEVLDKLINGTAV